MNEQDGRVAHFQQRLAEHQAVLAQLSSVAGSVVALATAVEGALRAGGKLLLFGNGGSAADSQHLAAEFINRFRVDRPALPALALSTDTSVLTSISNDSAYQQVFARQVEALGRPGDVAVGLSTSGTSANVLRGLEVARGKGLVTALFTGEGGRGQGGRVDHLLVVPSRETARIQEGHIFLGHMMCELVETALQEPVTEVLPSPPKAEPAFFVHPSSYVDEGASVGAGTKIWFFCHVQKGARVGRDCIMGQNVNIDRDAVVGNGVKIQNNVSVYKGVIVEDDAFLGPSMVFTNVINPRSHVNRRNEFLETRVGRGATIGANATVVCGHTVGDYAFVGAGAVVSKDIPPYALVTGNPARIKGWMCQCGIKLELPASGEEPVQAVCRACGKHYQKVGTVVTLQGGQ